MLSEKEEKTLRLYSVESFNYCGILCTFQIVGKETISHPTVPTVAFQFLWLIPRNPFSPTAFPGLIEKTKNTLSLPDLSFLGKVMIACPHPLNCSIYGLCKE